MANALTGDFDAVLEVSGGTVNRLLASMHQNDGAGSSLPSLPHSAGLRIGDGLPVGAVQGTFFAQVGVPQVELIDGSVDSFGLEVGVRARYRPDPQSGPLPEFIEGTVRATYRLSAVDPKCWGWAGIASDYIWPRVEPKTVSFTGTAVDDPANPAIDEAAVIEVITSELVTLLETTFAATPQKLAIPGQPSGFRRGSVLSLNRDGASALAIPIPIDGADPSGQLDSVGQIFLDGSDFGVAVSSDHIMSLVQGVLDNLRFPHGFTITTTVSTLFDIEVATVTFAYSISVQSSAEWLGGLTIPGVGSWQSSGLIKVVLTGHAHTDSDILPDVDFDVTVYLSLNFTGGDQATITVAALSSPAVNVHAGGLRAIASQVENDARLYIEQGAENALKALTQLPLTIDADALTQALQALDDQAGVSFDTATFSTIGVVLSGTIGLAPRRPPVVKFAQTGELDGYTAFDSWIPGGRIDRFDWSWSWANAARPPGKERFEDRFVLRRPGGTIRTKFGVMLDATAPLPGLDGSGRICLQLSGVQVDPSSGELTSLQTSSDCGGFGFPVRNALAGAGTLLLREYGDPRKSRETTLVAADLAPEGTGANTLIVFPPLPWDKHLTATLRSGLSLCRRTDAGLLVLVLVPDGKLPRLDTASRRALRQLQKTLGAPLVVNEDVHGAWSQALSAHPRKGQPAWRLLNPNGGHSWSADGPLTAGQLANSLDTCLFASAFAEAQVNADGPPLGTPIAARSLIPSLGGVSPPRCPLPPIGRGRRATVAFVQADSSSSKRQLDQLRREHAAAGNDALLVVVVSGKPAKLTSTTKQLTIPDPAGAIAAGLGISRWPTTVRVDETGLVTQLELGTKASEPTRERSA